MDTPNADSESGSRGEMLEVLIQSQTPWLANLLTTLTGYCSISRLAI